MAPAIPDRSTIGTKLFADETQLVRELAAKARLAPGDAGKVREIARGLVGDVRAHRTSQGGIDAFMQEYSLSSEEGVVLMCLAEALLRIPDAETADKLIADKLGGKDWDKHVGQSESLFVNASAWGLMLTGRFIELGDQARTDIRGFLGRLMSRSGEPLIRQAMRQAMRIMGKQFVLGRTIDEALKIARPLEQQGYRFSYDMLGEAAMTMADADRYLESYTHALREIAQSAGPAGPNDAVFARPSISVKLSALHPRYDEKAKGRMAGELLPRLRTLAEIARASNLGLTLDAEEVVRLELSLELFAALAADPALAGWNGLGLAVQAYGKRALPVLEWVGEVGRATHRRIPVRLVKGAYWDTEIKRAQEAGYDGYPVFTRKVSTDISYLAGARHLLSNRDVFYPQFATHNAHTIASISVMAGNDKSFEFQRLHGMGQQLYSSVVARNGMNQPCRIYAPVGSHEDLLAYLVRRLLENGANTSFVNRLADDAAPIDEIIADPVDEVRPGQHSASAHTVAARYLCATQEFSRSSFLGRGHTGGGPGGYGCRLSGRTFQAAPLVAETRRRGRGRRRYGRRMIAGSLSVRLRKPAGRTSTGPCGGFRALAVLGWPRRPPPRRRPRAWRRSLREELGNSHASPRPRGGKNARQCPGGPARGGGFPSLLCQPGTRRVLRSHVAPWTNRRAQ